MNSRKWLPLLMCISILVICTFQVYWVRDNYARENQTLQIRAGAAFRETITNLQARNLHLPVAAKNALPGPKRIIIQRNLRAKTTGGGQQVITMANALRNSLEQDTSLKRTFIITTDSSGSFNEHRLNVRSNGRAVDYLLKLESLQDSLSLPIILKSVAKRFDEDKLKIPFTVTKTKGDNENEMTDVAVGFANPVTYHLNIGNTFPYLFNRILWPVLFSIFLMAVTIFSFVLMYRNVLRQQKLADIKNDFISNITHELKTPIATVAVAIEAMKRFNAMDDPGKTKEYLDISSNELQRLGLLVDNVLKISLFEKKKVTVTKEPLEFNQLVGEVIETMGPQFRKVGAQVTFHKAVEPMTFHGDKLHIMSVIYNLLDNAIKYSTGQPVIGISSYGSPGYVHLQVSDKGIGIDPAYQSRIFEKFFRAPLGNMHNVKGYGLGLSYVSHIVAEHNGNIDVQSEPGHGTSFTINFPS